MDWRARYESFLLAMARQLLRWARHSEGESHALDQQPAGSLLPESGPPADWLERVRRGAPGLLNALRLPLEAAPQSSDTTTGLSTPMAPAIRGVHSPASSPPTSGAQRAQRVDDAGWAAAAGSRAAHHSSTPEEATPHRDRIKEHPDPLPPTLAGREGQSQGQSRGSLSTAAHASPDRERPPSPEADRVTGAAPTAHPVRPGVSSANATTEDAAPAPPSRDEGYSAQHPAAAELRQYTFTAHDARIRASRNPPPVADEITRAATPSSGVSANPAPRSGSPATVPLPPALPRSDDRRHYGTQLTWAGPTNPREWPTVNDAGVRALRPADHARYSLTSDAAAPHPWPELPAEPTVDPERLAADLLRESERWRRVRLEQEGKPWSA